MEVGPIFVDEFYAEGRGPELKRVHWAYDGKVLQAIDYLLPDETDLRHVFFEGVQVFMFTPEEVINYTTWNSLWRENRKAAILCLGKSPWLQSFAPQHLSNCEHYQLRFYDELLDVICKRLTIGTGGFPAML